MEYCFVNKEGRMIEIPQEEREPFEGEIKVPLEGYYEVFNVQRYLAARYDFPTKAWVGVGEPIPVPIPEPTEIDIIQSALVSNELKILLIQRQVERMMA